MDNVNKVPRELGEVNGNDTTFSSRVLLYNRVNPRPSISKLYNTQSNVSKQGEKVVSIEPFKELGQWTTTKGVFISKWYRPTTPQASTLVSLLHRSKWTLVNITFTIYFFNAQANPFIAKIENWFSNRCYSYIWKQSWYWKTLGKI